ncbi:MAG: putative metal-dependent protease of the superfamily [Actinomycetia bacterium]|nr:putative metal-dependent protease of the superfamily [Actinomycetes bacterium]
MASDPGRAPGVKVAPAFMRLTESEWQVVVGSCYDGYPEEACGLFIGTMNDGAPTGFVSEARPCRNEAASSLVYRIDGRDQLAAMRAAEQRGEEIVGCWHSHTHTEAFPSPTDVSQAAWYPDWLYVIVSLKDDAPVLRAYRVIDGDVHEVPVALM